MILALEWQLKAKYSKLCMTIGPLNHTLVSAPMLNSNLVLQAVNKLQDLEKEVLAKHDLAYCPYKITKYYSFCC